METSFTKQSWSIAKPLHKQRTFFIYYRMKVAQLESKKRKTREVYLLMLIQSSHIYTIDVLE